jgi:hypothetical protein
VTDVDDNEAAQTLSLGWITGGSTLANKPWDSAIRDLCFRIDDARKGIDAPLNLNVVFHVPGNMLKPEFVGVRTGRFSKARALLMVQAALPEAPPPNPMGYLKDVILQAIDEAERWAVRRRVAADLSKQRDILERASAAG